MRCREINMTKEKEEFVEKNNEIKEKMGQEYKQK